MTRNDWKNMTLGIRYSAIIPADEVPKHMEALARSLGLDAAPFGGDAGGEAKEADMTPQDDQGFFGSLLEDEELDQDQLEREAMEAFLEAEGICPDCGGPGGQHAVRCRWRERG